MSAHQLSQRRACRLIGITRRGLKRAPTEDRNRGLRNDCVNWRKSDGAGHLPTIVALLAALVALGYGYAAV